MNESPLQNPTRSPTNGGVLHYLAFPVILIMVIAASWFGYAPGREGLLTPVIFLLVFGIAILLERWFPFEPDWNGHWRDNRQDAAFFLLAQPVIAIAEAAALALGVSAAACLTSASGISYWPADWPIALQVMLALLVHDLLPYWYHRISHETGGWLWRLHAIHHAPSRMYSLNFIRFHPVNSFLSSFLMLLPMVALGVPARVIFLVAMISKVHSLLSHTNFDFRLGPLNWVFSMAELHRWHHVRDMRHANANYGATLIFWDVLFGTRKLPKADVRKSELGINDPESVPIGFCNQMCSHLFH